MKKGFTLVELSIVLVIIGLLIGGILVAQSLIDSAKTNKVVSLANQFKIMTQNFYDKTKCLPGDCGTNIITPSYFSGNNDGALGKTSATSYTEPLRAATHLQMLGVYQYDGDMSHCWTTNTDDINCFIQGPHNKSIFSLRTPSSVDTTQMAYGPYNMPNWNLNDNWLQYGQHFELSASTYQEASPLPILTPAAAKSIDIKTDDGNPSNGIVRGSRKHSINLCLTSANSTPGVDYDLSKDDPECNVFFYISNGTKIYPSGY